jgi:hypothetical protein
MTMDHDTLRKTYSEMNERACTFEQVILAVQGKCVLANRFCLAEREGIHCRSDDAQKRCQELLEALRHHSRFTLKLGGTVPLPHGKKMQIQMGGLRGVHAAVYPGLEIPNPIADIHGLVEAAEEQFGRLNDLPFQDIVKHIAAHKVRKAGPEES